MLILTHEEWLPKPCIPYRMNLTPRGGPDNLENVENVVDLGKLRQNENLENLEKKTEKSANVNFRKY